jgi:hypothetical protein
MKKIFTILAFLLSVTLSFGQNTDAELTTQANTIRNETTPGANTAVRVGNMFLGLVNSKVNVLDYTFTDDIDIVLPSGRSFGKYVNGDTAPWEGLTLMEAILDAVTAYINPVFNSFSITGQATTVEVGTTLSGSKTFTWSINPGSGTVGNLDIYDNTAGSTLLAATPNDGTQSVTITTNQLNSNGATQSWRGIGQNTAPSGTFNSSNFVVTARYYRFYGPVASSPTNSAEVRALPSSAFHTGAATFNLNTGTTQTKFVVALPPGVTISSVVDLDALNANITSEYVLIGTMNVQDAGGTNRAYNIYEMNIGAPYSSSHRHQITTAN